VNEIDFLTLEDAIEMILALGVGPIRDVGLLDSAIARPRSSAFGEDAYPTIDLKAAALLHSLSKNHALVDGNKRIAWLATTVFLRINGYVCRLNDEQAFSLVWDVSSDERDLSTIANRLNIGLAM
jgi:death on curing protein